MPDTRISYNDTFDGYDPERVVDTAFRMFRDRHPDAEVTAQRMSVNDDGTVDVTIQAEQ